MYDGTSPYQHPLDLSSCYEQVYFCRSKGVLTVVLSARPNALLGVECTLPFGHIRVRVNSTQENRLELTTNKISNLFFLSHTKKAYDIHAPGSSQHLRKAR